MTAPATSLPDAADRTTGAPGTELSSPRGVLWRAIGSRRRDLVAASVFYSTHQLGEAMVPVIIGATISDAVQHGDWAAIGGWLAVLAGDFALLSLSYRLGARASMRAKQHTGQVVRMWLSDRVVQPAGGIRNTPGDLLSRATSDAGRVGAFAGILATVIAAAVVLVVSTLLLLRFSPLLGSIIVAGTVVLLIVQNRVSGLLRRRSAVEQHEQARSTALAEDLIRGLRVLKGIGAERTAANEYRRVSQGAMRAALRATSSAATISAVGSLLSGIYLTVIAGVGGWLALSGHLGLGQLVSALGLAHFVIGPMRVVSGASPAYARALASAGRVHEVLVAEPAVSPAAPDQGAQARPDVGSGLAFEAVRVLDTGPALDAVLPANGMAGLVCADPVAAAAVPALLAREYDPSAGRLLLGGPDIGWHDIATLPLETLRTVVLVCPHDTVLLPGSIAGNLRVLTGDEGAVAAAAHAAFADQVIDAVPDGANTSVGDRGETLSGGQRQRIALARALAAGSPVLVLHDPTTAVDAATEDRIAERVRTLRTGRTTLVVTTSPVWLSRCDQVIYLDANGCRTGTHAELSTRVPAYRETVAR
ncbi:ABC transporter ATP-binding protein [Dactylosporangium sp. NPDC051484]|uniref:ABC transporter ATP-binding protein n=1 Tax=Dactylosporangium sp. NPDC051484 TaxID=3154942 RepID=UPI00344FC764